MIKHTRFIYLLVFLIFASIIISTSTSTTAIPTPPITDCKCLGYSLITLQVPLHLDLPNESDFDVDIYAFNGEHPQDVPSSRLIDMEWIMSHPEFLPLSNIDDMPAFPNNIIVDSVEKDKVIFTLKNINQETLPKIVTFKVTAGQIFHGNKQPIEDTFATFILNCNPELKIGDSFNKFTIIDLIKVENTSDVCKEEFCGNNRIEQNEQCEYPNTKDNSYCPNPTDIICQGNKSSRFINLAGDCNAQCQCVQDTPKFGCAKNSCGATCSEGEKQVESCGVTDVGECKLGTKERTCNDNSCSFGDFSQCTGNIDPVQEICNDNKDNDCDGKVDENCVPLPTCGDGTINNNEICELPSTNNNQYCSQSTSSCLVNKTGTRDSLGVCSAVCSCVSDGFSYSCKKDYCGASCSAGETKVEQCGISNVGICKLGTKTDTCNSNSCQFNQGQCVGAVLPKDEICNGLDDNCNGQTDENNICPPNNFCGDGKVNGNETCELPSTNNNQYCSQSSNICAGNKTGSRDSYGYCASQCSCVQDQFSFSCVKNSCGATCNPDEIKNETCGFNNVGICKLGTKTASCYEVTCQFDSFTECVGEILPGNEICNQLDDDCDGLIDENNICGTIPVCGNNKLEQGEECDPPGQVQAQSCGTTDTGECQLGTQTRTCNYQCKWDSYGQCTGNIEPSSEICDSKDNNCNGLVDENNVCVPQQFCGDGNVTLNEQCELPSTNNNQFCSQSTNSCQGNKTGSRDLFGYCSSQCGCVNDQFNFACQKGSCNAQCNPGETQTESCGVTDVGECKLGNKTKTCDGNSCSFGSFGQCVGAILPGNEICNQLDDDCDGSVDEGNVCQPQQFCGDGKVNGNESCELPSTNNNQYCSQSITSCIGNKTGNRDNLGYCSTSCGCVSDQFSSYSCVKGSCDASCSVNEKQVESCGVTDVGECQLGTKERTCNSNTCSFNEFSQCTGNIDPVTEICNDHKDNDCDSLIDSYDGDCEQQPICGNGIKEDNEQCDDGNLISGDGCSSTCKIEEENECPPILITDETGKLTKLSTSTIGIGTTPIVSSEFPILIFLDPNSRILVDDCNSPGRVSGCGQKLVERINNYAFEGEQIKWDVFVYDKSGIEDVKDVFVSLGPSPGPGNDIEANCKINDRTDDPICAFIDEKVQVKFNSQTSRWYTCTLTVETPESMYGEYFVTVEAEDLDGNQASMDEQEYWFFNPTIGLNINGEIDFGNVRPGTIGYSRTLSVENAADQGSGVLLDMFISGTDFYDISSSGALCPDSNVLRLSNFRYYAVNGAYNTKGNPNADIEGYRPIPYERSGSGGLPNNGRQEMIQNGLLPGGYSLGNVLSPGAEQSITFKLNMPEPCNGDFNSGQIFFWGEAI